MNLKLVYCDQNRNILEHQYLQMAVFDGLKTRAPFKEELMPVPEGSDFFLLPDREPKGIDPDTGKVIICDHTSAVSIFLAPAYLRLTHPTFHQKQNACILPLFAYAPLGFYKNKFYTTALRIDQDSRQDPTVFNIKEIKREAGNIIKLFKTNRLVKHLGHCALEYGCRAAQNFFLGKFECPLPSSPLCNAKCLGCISFQKEKLFKASHQRINFIPSPEEIAEVALFHINRVDKPVVSFGQGCEGEPLLVFETLEEAIKLIRKKTNKGTINLNTNGSRPSAIERLFRAGLNSIRLSLVSARNEAFSIYHNSDKLSLSEVLCSLQTAHNYRGFVSLNYLVFPGFTDSHEEALAMEKIIRDYRIEMIQMRNLNIDPHLFIKKMEKFFSRGNENIAAAKPIGLINLIKRFKSVNKDLKFGYFNPYIT